MELVAGTLEPGASISQHLTIYDIQNFLSAHGPEDWTMTLQERGVDATDVAMRPRDDSPRFVNVTWTYHGTARITAPADLGTIGISIAAPPGDPGPAARSGT